MAKGIEEKLKQVWPAFMEWFYKGHNIIPETWRPDFYSIKVWLEFQSFLLGRKKEKL